MIWSDAEEYGLDELRGYISGWSCFESRHIGGYGEVVFAERLLSQRLIVDKPGSDCA